MKAHELTDGPKNVQYKYLIYVAGPGAISSHPLPPRVSTSDESSVENQTVYKKPAFKPNPKSGKGSRKKKSENEEVPDESDADHAPLGGKGDDDSDEDGEVEE